MCCGSPLTLSTPMESIVLNFLCQRFACSRWNKFPRLGFHLSILSFLQELIGIMVATTNVTRSFFLLAICLRGLILLERVKVVIKVCILSGDRRRVSW